MNWWDDLWLNEGFATWCENYLTDVLHPEYKMWDQYCTDFWGQALTLDALKTSHPIQVPIKHAEEVEEVFDSISYAKGGTVIRMAKSMLGFETFKKGVQTYMKRHQYSNTETVDLWKAFEDIGHPISEIMSTWTEQLGFPMIQVTSFSIAGNIAKLSLKQSVFLASGEDVDDGR